MAALQIEPVENMVAISFLDDEDEAVTANSTGVPGDASGDNEGLFAICVGAGKKVTVCKRGDTIIVDKWARNGLLVGDDTYIVEAWCVKGKVTAAK